MVPNIMYAIGNMVFSSYQEVISTLCNDLWSKLLHVITFVITFPPNVRQNAAASLFRDEFLQKISLEYISTSASQSSKSRVYY